MPAAATLLCALCLACLAASASLQNAAAGERPGAGHRTAPEHFIFFGGARERISEAPFLNNDGIAGAQIRYTWRQLEPEPDRYDLRPLLEDLAFLERHGKRLFVQVQDVSFSEAVLVPDYLRADPAFNGGVARKYEYEGDDESNARFDGWVARRWDPAVRDRFARLLRALGRELDGRIEGLNLAETAVGFGESGRLHPDGFTYEGYLEGVKENMTAARRAFSRSPVLQYANFMPGEWLPWNDRGYLRAVYAHAARIGAGVGGPDLLPHRKGQQQHSYPLIAGRPEHLPAGVAVQDGNLASRSPDTGKRVTVEDLYGFAKDRLRLDYIFWGTQEPYYSEEILPFLRDANRRPRADVRGRGMPPHGIRPALLLFAGYCAATVQPWPNTLPGLPGTASPTMPSPWAR